MQAKDEFAPLMVWINVGQSVGRKVTGGIAMHKATHPVVFQNAADPNAE
jgi:hypothetical protein